MIDVTASTIWKATKFENLRLITLVCLCIQAQNSVHNKYSQMAITVSNFFHIPSVRFRGPRSGAVSNNNHDVGPVFCSINPPLFIISNLSKKEF